MLGIVRICNKMRHQSIVRNGNKSKLHWVTLRPEIRFTNSDVIVTDVVYPRLQSTGQKSESVNTIRGHRNAVVGVVSACALCMCVCDAHRCAVGGCDVTACVTCCPTVIFTRETMKSDVF